jgi:hypothetical protein
MDVRSNTERLIIYRFSYNACGNFNFIFALIIFQHLRIFLSINLNLQLKHIFRDAFIIIKNEKQSSGY